MLSVGGRGVVHGGGRHGSGDNWGLGGGGEHQLELLEAGETPHVLVLAHDRVRQLADLVYDRRVHMQLVAHRRDERLERQRWPVELHLDEVLLVVMCNPNLQYELCKHPATLATAHGTRRDSHAS